MIQRALSWSRQPPAGATDEEPRQRRTLSWDRQPRRKPEGAAPGPLVRALSWGRAPRKAGASGDTAGAGARWDPSARAAPDDLTLLPSISDDSIVATIRNRFYNDHIYTACYQLVIAVNPCTLLPALYTRQVGTRCAMVAAPGGSEPAPAHVWRVSGQAYAGVRRGCERGEPSSQTIVISGESGAGKTESARLIQSHLLSMSALAPELSEAALAQTLLQSTLLLEGTRTCFRALGRLQPLALVPSSRASCKASNPSARSQLRAPRGAPPDTP